MPPCNKEVKVYAHEGGPDSFHVKCVHGADHEGQHEGHVWVLGKNRATGGLGVISVIHWL